MIFAVSSERLLILDFNMNRLISVVVPVYNVEDVLHFCIDSILNQTYSDFELLLVDDGSTDKSGDICDQYARKDTRIRVFHKENGGVSSARNLGIDNANGEYICFIDSDDYVNSEFLDSLIKTKTLYPHCDNVWCCFSTVSSPGGNPVNSNKIKMEEEYIEFSRRQIMTLHDNWLDAGPVCKLYQKEIIDENKIRFNESISLGEDLIFNFEYLDKTNGQIIVKNAPLYYYVQMNCESLSTKYYPDLFEIYKHNNKIMWSYIDSWGCDDEQKQLFYNSCFFLYERVLENTYHKDSDCVNRIRYNNEILKSVEFSKALHKSNCYINPIIRFAYEHHLYQMVRLIYYIHR